MCTISTCQKKNCNNNNNHLSGKTDNCIYQLPVLMTGKWTARLYHTIEDWNNLCQDIAIAMFDQYLKNGWSEFIYLVIKLPNLK